MVRLWAWWPGAGPTVGTAAAPRAGDVGIEAMTGVARASKSDLSWPVLLGFKSGCIYTDYAPWRPNLSPITHISAFFFGPSSPERYRRLIAPPTGLDLFRSRICPCFSGIDLKQVPSGLDSGVNSGSGPPFNPAISNPHAPRPAPPHCDAGPAAGGGCATRPPGPRWATGPDRPGRERTDYPRHQQGFGGQTGKTSWNQVLRS